MKISAKSIATMVEFANHGSVNKNGNLSSQGYALMGCENVAMDYESLRQSNVTYNKHNFVNKEDENGKVILNAEGNPIRLAMPRISGNCIRNGIFKDQQAPIPTATLSIEQMMSLMVSESSLLRGFLITGDNERKVNRSSPLYLPEAKCIGEPPFITFDVNSNEGSKTENIHGEDKAIPNFYFTETIGDWSSRSIGLVNLEECQFISFDELLGRPAISENDKGLFLDAFRKRYGVNVELGYYKVKTLATDTAEYGILLPNEVITKIVRYYLHRLIGFEIIKAKASMWTTSVKIKIRNNENATEIFSNRGNWILLTAELIDSIEITVDSKYVAISDEVAEKNKDDRAARKVILNTFAKDRKQKSIDKSEKKAAKK